MGIGNSFFYLLRENSNFPYSTITGCASLRHSPGGVSCEGREIARCVFFFLNSVDVPFVAGFYHKWNIAMENQRV